MIEELFHDYDVETAPEYHKHNRPGWVNVECPFCSGEHAGYHLGFNEDGKYFYCWRCGGKLIIPTLATLLDISKAKAQQLAKEYRIYRPTEASKAVKVHTTRLPHRLPTDTVPLQQNHRRYLERRGFEPDYLVREWGIMGTGPAAKLDKTMYRHRILAPIHWQGRRVSFQTRDITDRQSMKYLACPQQREIIDHQHIVYCREDRGLTDVGVIVEGIFDVWRMGPQAVGTFGIDYTRHQLRVLSKLFRRSYIIFDNDPQARLQAQKLAGELKFRGQICAVIHIEGDPALLSQEDADYLLKTLKIQTP